MAAGRYAALLHGHLTTLDGALSALPMPHRAARCPTCSTLPIARPASAAAAAAPAAGAGACVRRRLSAYLPLLLMALLALGTWWLVKNTPLPDAPREPRRRATSPTTRCSASRCSASTPTAACACRSRATQLRHYPDTDTLEIDDVRIRAVAADGRVTWPPRGAR